MFFKPLTNKTTAKLKTELKYKLFFWNKLYGLIDERITHKLDYIPESWIVIQFSSLHSHLIYDTIAFNDPLYKNLQKSHLQIQQMSLESTDFPTKNRDMKVAYKEYFRIKSMKFSNWSINHVKRVFVFTIQIPNHNIFLATNLIFIRRNQLRWRKKCIL